MAGGQHQDRRRVPLAAELARGLEAVHHRHQHVEDDRVDPATCEREEGLLAVGGQLDLVTLQPQGTLERLTDRPFVVDDENTHGASVLYRPESKVNL